MYIYSIFYSFCKFRLLSYGNPMGMLWESYGADSRLIAKCECKGSEEV